MDLFSSHGIYFLTRMASKKYRLETATDQIGQGKITASGDSIDVFLSFSTKDKNAVERVADAMRAEGLSPWMYHKSSASADTTYPGPIVGAVLACRKVAVMCSDNSFRSDDVVREMHVAKRASKPLVAFFLDKNEAPNPMPADFEYFLPGCPWIFVQT